MVACFIGGGNIQRNHLPPISYTYQQKIKRSNTLIAICHLRVTVKSSVMSITHTSKRVSDSHLYLKLKIWWPPHTSNWVRYQSFPRLNLPQAEYEKATNTSKFTTLKLFWTYYGKKCMLFSLNFPWKETILPTWKGNNFCKAFNFRIKIGNGK